MVRGNPHVDVCANVGNQYEEHASRGEACMNSRPTFMPLSLHAPHSLQGYKWPMCELIL